MSKTKRLLAVFLAVLMVMSSVSVVAFAEDTVDAPIFADVYSSEAENYGVQLKNTAYLVDAGAAAYGNGDWYITEWEGFNYAFKVGTNVFASIDAALAAAAKAGIAVPQIMLSAGVYGDLSINQNVQFFGPKWNVNPNVKSASGTEPFTLNPAWESDNAVIYTLFIANKFDEGKGDYITPSLNFSLFGVEIQGRVVDAYRPDCDDPANYKFGNILMNHTAAGTSSSIASKVASVGSFTFVTTRTYYTFNFENRRVKLGDGAADEAVFYNLRLQNMSVDRFMGEYIPAKTTFDGLYFDATPYKNVSYIKIGTNFEDGALTFKNSCFVNSNTAKRPIDVEGYNKANCGTKKMLLNITDNLFYNVCQTAYDLRFYSNSFSSIKIEGNTAVNSGAALENALAFLNIYDYSGSKKYPANASNVSYKNNRFFGFKNFNFTGGASGKTDATGIYVSEKYSPDWQTNPDFIGNGVAPTGNVTYTYYNKNAVMLPDSIEVENATLNGDTYTVTAPAGLTYTPVVKDTTAGRSGVNAIYKLYASDENFSNANSFEDSEQLSQIEFNSAKSYNILAITSPDGLCKKIYKLVACKANSGLKLDSVSGGAGSTYTDDTVRYELKTARDEENITVSIVPIAGATITGIVNNATGEAVTHTNGVFNIKLDLGESIEYKVGLSGQGTTDSVFVNVTRAYSDACELVGVTGLTNNAGTYTASVDYNTTEYAFTVQLPLYAKAALYQGSSVFTADENGKITARRLATGDNVFTLGILAEDGKTLNNIDVVITRAKNNAAEVLDITNAKKVDGGYTVTVTDPFEIKAVVSQGATYKIYSDAACTNEISSTVEAKDGVYYIVATSEDGSNNSAAVKLTVVKLSETLSVEGAVADKDNDKLLVLTLAKDLKETTLNVISSVPYELYADKNLTVKSGAKIALSQGTTYIYAKVTTTGVVYTIAIVSDRSVVNYTDAASIPGWAQSAITKLNQSGQGIILGDEKGNFNASNNMTRNEIAAIAVRLLGIDATQYASVKLPFTDKIATWAENYIKAVYALGIMDGSNDKNGNLVFDGQGTTTRAQLAKIIVGISFMDNGIAQSPEAYYEANKATVDNYYNTLNFADEDSVQNWAKPYMRLAVFAKYFSGSADNGKNLIRGKDNIKRSEIASVVVNYLGL